ncbi:MAG: VWA domain-containing protein [Acidobacteria bacterium]|nr:VWA domain-containing protein [Acidobacteriota bacterium]
MTVAFGAAAQQGDGGTRSGEPAQTTESADAAASDQEYVFPVEIQVVSVPITVTDTKGQFVTDLDKRDFTIYDNGQPQRIDNFELTSEPLSLAIIVETSGRVQPLLSDVRAAGILITDLILGESGEATVLGFDREVKVLQEFTADHDKIAAAFKSLTAGPDQVHLSDAVARAIFMLQRRSKERRKVVIVISEARDSGSRNSFGLVLRSAQQLGISVYTVGLSTIKALFSTPPGQNAPSSPYPPGVMVRPTPGGATPSPDAQNNWGAANVNLLEIISDVVTYTKNLITGNPLTVYAAGTGGADFSTDSKAKIENALGRIGQELRNQYVLTYRPNNLDTRGFHNIHVALARRNLQARYRPGYMVAPPIRNSRTARPAQTPPPPSAP